MNKHEREKIIQQLEEQECKKIKKQKHSILRSVRKCLKYIILHPVYSLLSFLDFFKKRNDKAHLIAISAGGGIGDIVRANTLIKSFYLKYPNLVFDVFVNNIKIGRFLFGNLPNVRTIQYEHFYFFYKRFYENAMSTMQITLWEKKNINLLPREMIETINKTNKISESYKIHREHCYHRIIRESVAAGLDFMDILGRTAGLNDIGNKKGLIKVNNKNPLHGKKYITFSTSSNKNDRLNETATKCWPYTHWASLIKKIKSSYPEVELIQLGENNATPVKEANHEYLGNTTLETAAAILKESLFHIDCDCGLVHIAKALGTRCLVLFGPTSAEYVGYLENENIKSPICNNCWHIRQDWTKKCPIGLIKPDCMISITPEYVFSKCKYILEHEK